MIMTMFKQKLGKRNSVSHFKSTKSSLVDAPISIHSLLVLNWFPLLSRYGALQNVSPVPRYRKVK